MNKTPVFKSISIGVATRKQLLSQLVKRGVQFNNYAHLLFEHPAFPTHFVSEKINLAKVQQAHLNLHSPSPYSEILQRAKRLGLGPCPISTGAHLRLEYLDQPAGPYLTVVSESLEKGEGFPNGFYLRNLDNVLWLRGYRASDDYLWPFDPLTMNLYSAYSS